MKKYKESNIIIIITALKKVISIFFGPFLTAYFIKVSADSLVSISIYNIMNYIIIGIGGIIIGYIVRNKFQVGMFRVGVISNFIYILSIIVLKQEIIKYLPLISFLYGFSTITYFYPYNLFVADKISNRDRTEYEFKRKTISSIIAIITPIILGGIITTTNFELTAIIILFISLIQIILSFFLKPICDKDYKYTLVKSFNKMIKDKNIVRIFFMEYFKGLNVSEGALEIILTILIFNAFKTNLNLGILTSLSSITIIIMQYIYTKKYKNKDDKKIIIISSIVPIISIMFLLLFTNNITLTLYYFCYNTFVNLLCLIIDVRLYNISNSSLVKDSNQMEFWSIREVILNLGRLTGHILVLAIAIFGSYNDLYYLMIVLTITIGLMGWFGSRVDKYNDSKNI